MSSFRSVRSPSSPPAYTDGSFNFGVIVITEKAVTYYSSTPLTS